MVGIKINNYFFKISDLLAPAFWAGSALVPSQGWVMFGGYGNSLTTAQQLKSADGKWETGPSLFEESPDFYHCVVQVCINLDN